LQSDYDANLRIMLRIDTAYKKERIQAAQKISGPKYAI